MQKLGHLKETPSQTAGPYIHIGATPNFCGIEGVYDEDPGVRMLTPETRGERIRVTGRVFDGGGNTIREAVLEIWQADAAGHYPGQPGADPNFTGWGRQPTEQDGGVYTFETIKPGRVTNRDGGLMAPHLSVWIAARGVNIGLHTRMYFADEEAANAEDPVLARIEHRDRVTTLLAPRDGDTYTFDIRLQGDGETIFFDI